MPFLLGVCSNNSIEYVVEVQASYLKKEYMEGRDC